MNKLKKLEDLIQKNQLHDSTIHGIKFFRKKYQIEVDIDFIREWKQTFNKGEFKISKANMIFTNVRGLNLNINSIELTKIDNVRVERITDDRSNLDLKKYIIDCHTGDFEIVASSCEIDIYDKVYIKESQSLDREEISYH